MIKGDDDGPSVLGDGGEVFRVATEKKPATGRGGRMCELSLEIEGEGGNWS